MAVNEPSAPDVIIGASVVAGAAALGLVVGFGIEMIAKRKGQSSMGKKLIRIVEHAIQGFAMGTFAADSVVRLLTEDQA